jgi:hypothetical protein
MNLFDFIFNKKSDFAIVEYVNEATHWLACKDNNSIIKDTITPNKKYELKYLEDIFGGDYYIKDDQGQWTMGYMVHKGDFIKI